MEDMMDGMVTVMEFSFPAAVTQQQGPTEGVTIDGSKLTLDIMAIAGDSTYVFKTGVAAPAKPAVVPTSQRLTVNGAEKNTEIYNIDGANYFKLRDMAMLLSGTSSQFSVDYDAARKTIVVKTGEPYTPAGGELAAGADNSASAVLSSQSIEINGEKVDLTAYNIGGANFFKLRDLGDALGFGVDYDGTTKTMLVTSSEPASSPEPVTSYVIDKYLSDGDFTDFADYGREMGAKTPKSKADTNIYFVYGGYFVNVGTNTQDPEYAYVGIGYGEHCETVTYCCLIPYHDVPTVTVYSTGAFMPTSAGRILEDTINYMKDHPDPNQKPSMPGVEWIGWDEW